MIKKLINFIVAAIFAVTGLIIMENLLPQVPTIFGYDIYKNGFFGIAAIRFNGRERGGGPPGNGVHAFGGELVQRREDRGGIVQTPHAVIQISQNGQCVALFLRKRHLNPLSSGPCRR